MIRTTIMLAFWTVCAPIAALIGFPTALLTGSVKVLYALFMWGARAGVWLTGVRVQAIGLERFDHSKSYIFMTNHVSNLDPPIEIPLIPRQTSIMVKQELFKVPILGRAMRMGQLVPVDRAHRDAGIEAVRRAKAVVENGMPMTIYVEGKRSFDGYLAMECGVPVVPMTIVGTHYVMPKRRYSIKPGKVTVIFHEPIEPKDFISRDSLMERVRSVIESGLPEEYRHGTMAANSS
jgi:1-acyl-sn-glycerol-3-phosphate acyltransferase